MTRPPLFLAMGLALAGLSGCVDAGGPGYVESTLVNEGPVGSQAYRRAPVYRDAPAYRPAPSYRSTVVIDSGPRYSNRGSYGDPRYAPRQDRYGRDPYDDRGSYSRYDRNRYCADVGYDDPRCD